jgi:hypothetical protein
MASAGVQAEIFDKQRVLNMCVSKAQAQSLRKTAQVGIRTSFGRDAVSMDL